MRWDIAKFVKVGDRVYHAKGCSECNNVGYKGRIGLYEVLEINETIRRLIASNANLDDIYTAARTNGLILIMENGAKLIEEGTIDLPELSKVTALKE
jgi:type II secretory ATPase GspE/PulE/Tfp pilus assembly ATPase PilB-like protein